MPSVKGRYELLDVLGEGGMGVVYRALDQDLRREVAVKTIRDSMDRMVLDLFRRECGVLASLNHPNIVDIYDIGEFEDKGTKKPYFVMPLLPGAPLSALLKNQTQRLTPERVIEIMTQALRGLQAAHERNLVHRDLKPSNIFVLDDDSVKIIDFGVAHLANTHSTVGLKGTLFYMAPEQLEMQTPTALSDVFSMGVVCYEILTRRRPFTGSTNEEVGEAIRKHIPPPVSDLNPAVNSALSQIIHAALAKQPWHRFSTAREFAEALQKAVRNQPIERFDPAKLDARLQRAKTALAESEYEFAGEILTEMESEGHVHPEIRPLRKQIDQANRNRMIRQLLDGAERRLKDDEYTLALEKIQQIIQLDPSHVEALKLKASIESKRSSQQIDNWLRLASDHLDNFSFGYARQALQKLMQVKPGDTRALQLLESVDRKEQSYLAIKREKEQHYQAALECWRQGEVSSALSQVERLMALDREAPERSDVERGAAYQDLFNKVRSEHEDLRNAYSEAKKHLEDGNFSAGLAICDTYLEKYPQHALFQSMRLDIGEAQRQALSAFIARVDREVQGEPDLDRKVGMLEAALTKHPGEAHFEQALKAVSARRGHINTIVARAQNLEERGQYTEALNQWEMLRTVYRQYPGLAFEIERLERRKEQQASADRKTRIIEQADAALKSGDFAAALHIILSAQADFPNDEELTPMEKLARDGIDRLVKAEDLIFQSRELIREGRFEDGLKLLDEAYGMADRSEYVRAALLDALLNHSSAVVDTDPQYAESLVRRALMLDGANPQAKSLRLRIADRKRESTIHSALSRARKLQADGQIGAAEVEVTHALEAYPGEPRLNQLRATLQQASEESSVRHNGHLPDAQPANRAEPQALLDGQAEVVVEGGGIGATRMFDKAGNASPSQAHPSNPPAANMAAATPPAQAPRISTQTPAAPLSPAPLSPEPGALGAPDVAGPIAPRAKTNFVKLAAMATGLILIIAAVVFIYEGRRPPPIPPRATRSAFPVRFSSNIPGANLTLDAKALSLPEQSLTPGSHTVVARAVGYLPVTETFKVVAGQTSPLVVNIQLQPAPAELRVASDLTAGQAMLDGTAIDLQSGGLIKSDLSPGDHTFKIIDGGQELVSFAFTTKPAAAVTVNGPIATKRIPAIVISSLGTEAKVWSSAGLRGGETESAIQPIAADGVSVSGLVTGNSTFLVEDGRTPPRVLALEPTAVPSIRVDLGVQRQTGTIIVHSNVPDSTVVISGTALKQPMRNGTQVLTLGPNDYRIKVMHADYEDVAEQAVDLKKGDSKTLNFELLPAVHMGSLALERFPPETEVSIDGTKAGTTDAEGNFSKQLAPGTHAFTLHKMGYSDVGLKREIKAGVATAIAGETVMPRPGTVTFKLTPGKVHVTYGREDDSQTFEASNGQTITLPAGSYRILGEADGYQSKSDQFVVEAGKSHPVELALSPVEKAPENKGLTIANMCQDPAQWTTESGWWHHREMGFGWFVRNNGDYSMTFYKQSSKVFFKNRIKHIEWVVDSQPNGDHVSYILDEHMLRRVVESGGASHEQRVTHGLASDSLRLQMDISPGVLVVRTVDGKALDEYKRPDPGTPLGKFGVKGEVMLVISRLR